ncbi:ribosome-binding factor A [endosymbiont DhMRE of Dentiscutata heterogama]|uniref:ribosome-binding factor A n=1 Tax=endosymbiont DhMRE of Dentiscutata heterogama TaxID=1609546 RepID=UPI002AD31ED8|nr:ribosome-binding factor A [endosymbiont DhMRE of Dentiscutata heterogama]
MNSHKTLIWHDTHTHTHGINKITKKSHLLNVGSMNIKTIQPRKQNPRSWVRQTKKSFYEREISRLLHQMVQEYNLPSCSLSYCETSTRGEHVKIYLSFARPKNQTEILQLMNKKYSSLLKKEIAKSKKFAYIPHLVFLLDKELETMNNLKKILQEFTHAN